MSKNSLSVYQELRQGDFLMSENQKYKACFQEDGNFVIYEWSATWASNTECSKAQRVILQDDTNLVMYTATGEAPWCSGSYTQPPTQEVRLTLTNDGHLVVDNKGSEVWRSKQCI